MPPADGILFLWDHNSAGRVYAGGGVLIVLAIVEFFGKNSASKLLGRWFRRVRWDRARRCYGFGNSSNELIHKIRAQAYFFIMFSGHLDLAENILYLFWLSVRINVHVSASDVEQRCHLITALRHF
jgi:hypothetical protein